MGHDVSHLRVITWLQALLHLIRLHIGLEQALGPGLQVGTALACHIVHQATLPCVERFQQPRPHGLIIKLPGFLPGSKKRIAGLGARLAVHPEALCTLPGCQRIGRCQPGAEVIALEFNAVGLCRHHGKKISPALLLPRTLQVYRQKAIGQGGAGAALQKQLRVTRAHGTGFAAELKVVQIHRQRILIEGRA